MPADSARKSLPRIDVPYALAIAQVRDYAIYMLDPEGRAASWNEGVLRILGWEEEEWIGQPVSAIFPPEAVERGDHERELQMAMQHGSASDDRWQVKKDGTRFFANGITTAVRGDDGRVVAFMKVMRDKTAQQQSEEQLERFRFLADIVNDSVMVLDAEGTIVYANRHACEHRGYPDSSLIGHTVAELDPLYSIERFKELFQRARHEPIPIFESIHRRKDGSELPVEISVAFFEAGGRPFISAISRDIEVRKRIESERAELLGVLGAERSRLLAVFKRSPAFMAILSGPEHVFEMANDRFLALVGHRDIVGKPVRTALPEITGQGYVRLLDQVYSTGETFVGTDMKVVLLQKPAQPAEDRFVDFVYQPVLEQDGSISGIFVHGVETTERKRAEQTLRRSEERYRTLIESIDEGFCVIEMIFDEAGKPVDYLFLETNAAFEEQTGLRDAVGKTMKELHPAHDQHWFEIYGHVALSGESIRFENEGKALGRWFDVYAMRIDEPEAHKVAVVFSNITERKHAAQEVAQILVRERAARSEAEHANRVKDEFLATLSHELRTPLNAILGWAQMLRRGKMSAEAVTQGIDIIERNARVQAQLIGDLLDMSRIISGKVQLNVQEVSPNEVAKAAIAAVQLSADAKEIRLEKRLDTAVGSIFGDPDRLQQVFWNLLSNAIKFTPRGGEVVVTVSRRGDHVEVSVRDTGKGIEAEFLPYVFEKFRQADASTTRVHGGLGLGLSIVKSLVELHGGTVEVQSEGEGRGTTFTVTLPISPTSARGRELHPPVEREETNERTRESDYEQLLNLKVLVVDDEYDARELIRRVLQDCGAEVVTAGSVGEALVIFERFRPDVLISDIGMPIEDGYDLIRKVRALAPESGGSIPAAALTAFARSEDHARAIRAGFQTHISKPVEPAELVAEIETLVRDHGTA